MAQRPREQLAEVLFMALIDDASDKHIAQLGEIITKYKETYARSYYDIKKQPFANALVTAIEEALEYREGVKK